MFRRDPGSAGWGAVVAAEVVAVSARIQAWLRMGASVEDCAQTLLAEEYCVDGVPVDRSGALRVVREALDDG